MVELLPFPSITQIGSGSRRGCEWSDTVLEKEILLDFKCVLVSVRWAIFIYCRSSDDIQEGAFRPWVGEAMCEASFPLELRVQLKSHLWETLELYNPNIKHSSYVTFCPENISSAIQVFGVFVFSIILEREDTSWFSEIITPFSLTFWEWFVHFIDV